MSGNFKCLYLVGHDIKYLEKWHVLIIDIKRTRGGGGGGGKGG